VEAEKQSSFTILHTLPFSITVDGGVGVSVTIQNNGTTPFTYIPFNITLDGGFQLRSTSISGKILSLAPGSSTVKALPVLGVGKVNITVTVDTIQLKKTGFVFLFFVLGVH